jgi:phosphatidylglycerol:prolipoprotein diacylglycerol transferase
MTSPVVHHPAVFHLGPVTVTGFGIAVALGFLIGHIVAHHELARRGHDPAPLADVLVAAVLGFVVGAKLYFITLERSLDALFSRSGLVFWGGLMGGIAACWLVIRRKRIPFLRIADVAGPAIAAGYAVGRTGCWAVGDDYGRPWSGPLAVQFPEGIPPSTAGTLARDFGSAVPPGVPPETVLAVHPTQLYETAMGLVMFLILWRYRDHKHAEGWLFGLYCVLAGIERLVVEVYRAKDDRFFGPFTSAQVVALGFLVGGAALIARTRSTGPGRPGVLAPRAGA